MSSTLDEAGGEQSGATATADEPTETESPAAEPVDLPLEQVFDVLRNERRRLVLVHMAAGDGTFTIGDLAEHVASHENDKPIVQLSSDERKRAYVGLYQCHLPKMDSMAIVSFNKARGKVELGPNYHRVEPYLQERTVDDAGRWPRRYLGLSLLASLTVGLAGFGGAMAAWAAAAAVVVLFTATSIYHWWQTPTEDDE